MVSDKIALLNAEYTNVTSGQLLEHIMEDAQAGRKAMAVFLNVDVVMKIEKDPYLKEIVHEAEYVLADGMPLIWFSKLLGTPLKEKISGSDFVPLLCERAAREGKKIFLLGGAEGIAQRAAERLTERFPRLRVVGTYAPPFGFEKDQEELEKINGMLLKARPDILIVCLGCPKQEKFIYENRMRYDVPISVCAGATVDFLAGNVKRCPVWMSRCGLEWFYRFLQEPRRLFRRYFIDDMQILRLLFKYRKSRHGTENTSVDVRLRLEKRKGRNGHGSFQLPVKSFLERREDLLYCDPYRRRNRCEDPAVRGRFCTYLLLFIVPEGRSGTSSCGGERKFLEEGFSGVFVQIAAGTGYPTPSRS